MNYARTTKNTFRALTLMALVAPSTTPTSWAQNDAALQIDTNRGANVLQLMPDGGFVVSGRSHALSQVPATGAGDRLMWYPGKRAFRVGYTSGDLWDDASIGHYSVAMGDRPKASGSSSFAFGLWSRALGNHSVAIGMNTEAHTNAVALGHQSRATGEASVGLGHVSYATGRYSTAMGNQTNASGESATSMGRSTSAATIGSLSLGKFNRSNQTADNTALVVGNGSGVFSRSDALVLDFYGNLRISGTIRQNSDERLKEDIVPIEDATAIVQQLRPVRYRFRAASNRDTGKQVGLIAQDVRKVLPELVHEDGDGYLSVNYAQLSAVLAQAVKEQQSKIEELSARLATIETASSVQFVSADAPVVPSKREFGLTLAAFAVLGLAGVTGLRRRSQS